MFGGENQSLLLGAGRVEDRAGVAGRVGVVQPDPPACVAIKCAAGRAGVQNNQVTPEQRRSGEAPAVRDDAIVAQVVFPKYCAPSRIEAKNITPSADREDFVAL